MAIFRNQRICHLRTLIIFGVLSLFITFYLLVFSGELNTRREDPDYRDLRPLVAQDKKISSQVKGNRSESALGDYNFSKDSRPLMMVKRVSEYCNSPHSQDLGLEGLVADKYKLLNVHVVIRHGDRSPIYRLPNQEFKDITCLLDTSQYSHVPKVNTFQEVLANSADQLPQDSTFSRWALYPSHSICGEGQLTGQGAIQHILNGMLYSERYVHKHLLFGSDDWHKNVVVYSTAVSRTFQSAVAFAFGLLPSFNLQKLNLNPSPTISFCEDKVFGSACICTGVDMFRIKADRECKMSAAETKKRLKLLSFTSEVLGVKSGLKIPGPPSLWDSFSGFACHSLPAPCNSNGTCITAKVLEATWELIDAKSKCLAKNLNYKKFTRAVMHGLLYRIAREFKVAIENGTNPKFFLYSGHDSTITPLITALDLSDNVWPGYAHRITFELYRHQDSHENYVRILRNGKVVTSETIFCHDKTEEHGMCKFSYFSHYVSVQNLKDFCNSIKPSTRLQH